MNKQSKALQLADAIDHALHIRDDNFLEPELVSSAAKELRRLEIVNAELLDALTHCEGNIKSLLASKHPAVFGTWLKVVSDAIAKANPQNDKMLHALTLIASTDPIEAALDPQRAIRVAQEALQEKVEPSPYGLLRISWELQQTAIGHTHYGNALRVAKDIPGLTDDDRALLDRYATGGSLGTDHVKLQDLAIRINSMGETGSTS